MKSFKEREVFVKRIYRVQKKEKNGKEDIFWSSQIYGLGVEKEQKRKGTKKFTTWEERPINNNLTAIFCFEAYQKVKSHHYEPKIRIF